MASTTDGAPSTAVDPGAGSTSWDDVLSEGIASTGIDPASSFPADPTEPVAEAPQSPESGSSAGALAGSPATPQAATTGDDGKGVVATPETATPAASDPPTDVSQIEGATPFTYTVDGQSKTIEGAFVLPGDGLYVPESRIPHFQLLASRAETVERQNRELYDQSKALERLTEWKQTGPDGKETVLTGREAVEASRVALGHALAEVQTLRQFISDPQKLASLLVHVGDGKFEHDPDRYELLKERLANLKGAVEHSVRQQVGRMASAPPPPVPALTPEQITERALPTVEAVLTAAKLSGLTSEDKQALARMVPRFTTTVTPQNAAQYPNSRLGETVLDYQAFLPEVQDRVKLREAATAAQKTATDVNKFNAPMSAARQSNKAPQAPKQPAAPPPQPAKVGKAEQWGNILNEALAEIV